MENIKYKYIFYNDKKEILVLNNGVNRFFIPGVIENLPLDSYGETLKFIVDSLVVQDKLVELGSAVEVYTILRSTNNKLYKTLLEEKKFYFSCYCEFTKEFCSQILDLCDRNNLIPNLIYIDDLIELFKNKKIKIDRNLIKPLEELDKRLSYKKY